MGANTELQSNVLVSNRPVLNAAKDRGRFSGFGNMTGKELGDWFQTKRWLTQSIGWLAIINGLIALVLFLAPILSQQEVEAGNAAPAEYQDLYALGLSLFFSLVISAGGIGTVILSQDEIVGEKQSGTAAWMLSKPVARQAFVLSKLVSNAIGILIFIVALPALVAFFEIPLASGKPVAFWPFVFALSAALLGLVFYLCLTILLGVLFSSHGPVIAIPLALLLGGNLMSSFIPQMNYLLPVSLSSICVGLATGMALPPMAVVQIGVTALWCIVFLAAALWRFDRQEL